MGLKRHWELFRLALMEEQASPPPRHHHERAFLPAVLEITDTPAPAAGRAVAGTIIAFFTLLIAWSILSRVDVFATAQGKVSHTGQAKIIQPLEAGIVREIAVAEGALVKAGDLLVVLDATDTKADAERLTAEALEFRLEMLRFQALVHGGEELEAAFSPPDEAPATLVERHRSLLRSRWLEHRARLAVLTRELARKQAEIAGIGAEMVKLDRILPLVEERTQARKVLSQQGNGARLQFLELEQERIATREEREVKRFQQAEAQAALASLEEQRRQEAAQFQGDNLAQLLEAARKVEGIEQELIKARERHRRQRLTAPVAGTVQQLVLHTIGGVVTPAQELMRIIPADRTLLVEALLPNKDVGFVTPQQPAEIKIETFPFTRFGTIPATVTQVSRDAVADEQLGLVYAVRLALARDHMMVNGETVPLTPGMVVTAEIHTDQRRIIEYLIAPLLRYGKESFRER